MYIYLSLLTASSSRLSTTATRKLFGLPTDKHKDGSEEKRQKIYEELKELLPNGCFTSFYEKEMKISDEAPLNDSPLASQNENLIINLAYGCKTVNEFVSKLPILTEATVQHIEHETVGQ